MKNRLSNFILLGMAFCLAAIFLPADTSGTQALQVLQENQRLEAELSLANTPKLYLVFDLNEKTVYLKARGIILQEWPMEILRFWGNAIPLRPIALKEKRTPFPPQRVNIIPPPVNGEGEEGKTQAAQEPNQSPPAAPATKEPDALELVDMPPVYTFFLEGNIRIFIKPRSDNFFKRLSQYLNWATYPPLLSVWYSMKEKAFTVIDVILKDEKDAQALFWAIPEGSPCIVLSPQYNILIPPKPTPSKRVK